MKIAIVTIYSAFNYGSFLQAYAMQETLKKMGNEVYMLNCSKAPVSQRLRKVISKTNPIFVFKRFLAYNRDWKKLNISSQVDAQYDAAIIGSDEVWNIKGYFEHWPQYLGEGINTKKLIAYAPSVGFSKPEELLSNEPFAEGVKRFDAICPRDNATRDVCMQLCNHVTERVVDPTLLLLDDWEALLPEMNKKDKYVVYYSYLDDSPMKEYILRFAKEHNMKVYIAGFNYQWGDKNKMESPLGFLTLLKNAEYVFTSTFHGSVMSTILKKNLVVRPSGQKVIDYLDLIGLSNRKFFDGMDYEAFESLTMEGIDYNRVRMVQNEMKKKSIEILERALANKPAE